MEDYAIEHDRKNCIGCGSCASICEENWRMEGSKSKCLKKNLKKEDFECNMRAAQSCPVNVIHIIEKKTRKRLI